MKFTNIINILRRKPIVADTSNYTNEQVEQMVSRYTDSTRGSKLQLQRAADQYYHRMDLEHTFFQTDFTDFGANVSNFFTFL